MSEKRQYVVVVNSVREQAYQTLRNEIVSMELKPGTVISTQDTATRLNLSRTPVREAFIQLQEERLLEISPQKATVVSKIDFNRVFGKHLKWKICAPLQKEHLKRPWKL